jgi:thiol-disulfide isomerase/thioredoxin
MEIELKRVEGIKPFYAGRTLAQTLVPEDSLFKFNGIPSVVKPDYRVWRLDLNLSQNLHERFMSGLATQKEIERHKYLDTTSVYNGKLRHDIHIMVGIHDGEKFVVVDSDNDWNFANNRVHIFNIEIGQRMSQEQWYKEAPVFMLNYERYDGSHIINERVLMQMFPFSPNTDVEARYSISTGQYEHYVGAFEVAGKKCQVAMATLPFASNFQYVEILWADSTDRFMPGLNNTDNIPYVIGDVVYFGDYKYQIDHVEGFGEKLVLVYIEKSPPPHLGFRIGEFISPLTVHTIDDREIKIADGGKYFIVHFWGLWCHNCLENLPKFRSLVTELPRDKVDVLGVCVDFEPERAAAGAKFYELDWNISFEYMKSQAETHESELGNLFFARSFPLYILISPEGKIIKRMGSKGLDEIAQFFKDN